MLSLRSCPELMKAACRPPAQPPLRSPGPFALYLRSFPLESHVSQTGYVQDKNSLSPDASVVFLLHHNIATNLLFGGSFAIYPTNVVV